MQTINDEDELRDWKTTNSKCILNFGATWCKNCTKLSPFLVELGKEFSIPIAKVDVDECQDLAEEYGVSNLPHTIFISSNTVVGSYIGSDQNILTENLRLFIASDSAVEIPSTPSVGIDLPIPIIHEVTDITRFPRVNAIHNNSKDSIAGHLLQKIGCDPTQISVSPASQQLVHLAFSNTELPHTPVDRCTGEQAIHNLFIFLVPRLNPEGTCSNLHDLSDRPFNLAVDAYGISESSLPEFLKDSNNPLVIRSIHLNRAVNLLYSLTNADWIGIYRVIDADNDLGLLKEAYLGEPSRAVFPLTQEFSLKSTNSWVGLNGEIRHIPNTRGRDEGVSYYECSGSVKSEICLPILKLFPQNEWRVIGIIDLESWNLNHFTTQMIADVLEVCFQLGECEEFCSLPK